MRYVHVAVGLDETVLLASGRRMKHIAAVCTVARDRSGINKLAAEKGKWDALKCRRSFFSGSPNLVWWDTRLRARNSTRMQHLQITRQLNGEQ